MKGRWDGCNGLNGFKCSALTCYFFPQTFWSFRTLKCIQRNQVFFLMQLVPGIKMVLLECFFQSCEDTFTAAILHWRVAGGFEWLAGVSKKNIIILKILHSELKQRKSSRKCVEMMRLHVLNNLIQRTISLQSQYFQYSAVSSTILVNFVVSSQ